MKILLVGHTESQHEIISREFMESNYEIHTAENAQSAIATLENNQDISLLISEVNMPDIDGFQLLTSIKADLRHRQTSIILISDQVEEKMVLRSRKLGASGFFSWQYAASQIRNHVIQLPDRESGYILLVDDEELMLNLLSRLFMREGIPVIKARSGQQALQFIENKNIRLILSDIKMPGMDGFKLLSKVKNIRDDLPVLLMTGYKDRYSKQMVLEKGFVDIITKPFNNSEILALVKPHFCISRITINT